MEGPRPSRLRGRHIAAPSRNLSTLYYASGTPSSNSHRGGSPSGLWRFGQQLIQCASRRAQPASSPHHSLGARGPGDETHAVLADDSRDAGGGASRGGEAGAPVDCCPSVLEMVEPAGGKNQEDMYVELYRDGDNRQRFYELSCRADVENKPCRFVDRKLYNQSKCVQKFSYTYALVRDINANDQHHQRHQRKQRQFPALPAGGWMLDYIRVRSGCACELRARKRHKKPPERRSHPKLDHASSTRESSPET